MNRKSVSVKMTFGALNINPTFVGKKDNNMIQSNNNNNLFNNLMNNSSKMGSL
ncbi:hypothetical protein [Marinifilum caeruleilacunae]|uniref:hypothetical protein n=1 Tax=Marinifilum caeruleilacunae TaxID=2499076 RepID=UPI00149316CC|nr:hypothetical protein [Marinifilum caeruleilacunae]